MCAATRVARPLIRYNDFESKQWWFTQSPCHWSTNSRLEFTDVPLSLLESSGSMRRPDLAAKWKRRAEEGRGFPPLIVSKTSHGTYYVHDGNHRLDVLHRIYEDDRDVLVRVACVVPRVGYCFRFRRFRDYATYRLEPTRNPQGYTQRAPQRLPRTLRPLAKRTLVLVAHPDDETGGCAGLLQRISEPLVFFATEGAPASEFFWRRFGSQRTYSLVRRHEAASALTAVGVKTTGFLGDWIQSDAELRDQELFKCLPAAFEAAAAVIRRLKPGAILVPAYEGGHPDHDACSFLGFLLKKRFGLAVWEMPLYHRSINGELTCRTFRDNCGTETVLKLSAAEQVTRRHMMSSYCSQWDLAQFINTPFEYFRPQVTYDYNKPPHSGLLNYQSWKWQISPTDVCQSFAEALNEISTEESYLVAGMSLQLDKSGTGVNQQSQ
jgi:LmbE family N-acetylglucosaminyl deacetylase